MHGNGLLQKSSFSAAEVLASTSAEAAERGSLRCEACCWRAAGVLLACFWCLERKARSQRRPGASEDRLRRTTIDCRRSLSS